MDEMAFAEKGGEHKFWNESNQRWKNWLVKSTEGYNIQYYSGLSMKNMIQNEIEQK